MKNQKKTGNVKSALLLLALLILSGNVLAACQTKPTVVTDIQFKYPEISDALLEPCPKPQKPTPPYTEMEVGLYINGFNTELGKCNAKLQTIKEIYDGFVSSVKSE